MIVHVVAHTHWDREWYQPLGRFRQRLVALVDELLDEPPRDGTSFLLDGQAIALEDYLAVRPERRAELSALLREGRLEAGPWYVLADELIPGGEAIVRNLLAGRRALRGLRASAPPVLYCPDSFGHPAMLPAIAQGFGLDAVMLWRGYGGPRWPAGDAAWWDSPDGSRALLLHLPPDGYEFGSNLPMDGAAARERWTRMRAVLAARSTLGVVILQNGADHHARQLDHASAIEALSASARETGDDAQPSSLGAFVKDALGRARDAQLPCVAGELRDSYGYTWTLQGTFGTRAAQKRANARVERLLVRDAEPWAAMARAMGAKSQRPLVEAAWRTLLECHPHDTLCGCSIDAVARAADVRWEDARHQGEGVRADALHGLIGHDAAAAHGRHAEWKPVLVIRNRAARSRRGVARLRVERVVAHVGVGPGSAGQVIDVPPALPPLELPFPHQVLSEHVEHARIESPRHYPDNDLVTVREVLALVGDVPGYGIVTLPLVGRDGGTGQAHCTGDERTIRNEHLTVTAGTGGRLSIESRDAMRIDDLLAIECHRDAGDLYTPAIREPAPPAELLDVQVLDAGPLRASLSATWTVPTASGGDASTITALVSLDAGEPFVRIAVFGDNRGSDQRLRLAIATGISTDASREVWADTAFGAARRMPLALPAVEQVTESPLPTAPLHRYVSLFDGDRGATVFSDGLAEYEALPDGRVAITLVRAVGELSRHDLPERPGHAGWPSPTPAAQSHGAFEARFALALHGGIRDAAMIDFIERTADDVLLPLAGETLRSAIAVAPQVEGITLEGTGLAFSAIKEAEDGRGVVLRCVNLTDDAVQGAWTVAFPFGEASLARLDETPTRMIAPIGGRIEFEAGPRAIVTIVVR